MSLFHDEEEVDTREPILGLPSEPPEGETVVWQGRPTALGLAVHAFHIRFVAAYFALATGWRMAAMSAEGAAAADMAAAAGVSALGGAGAIGLLVLLAWSMARAAVYTVTTKRVVLRYGVAIRKYVNLPFDQIASADLRARRGGSGDIALTTTGPGKVAYLHLWPFVRPLRFAKPQPMLRALPDAKAAAAILADAIRKHAPQTVRVAKAAAEDDRRRADPAPSGVLGAT